MGLFFTRRKPVRRTRGVRCPRCRSRDVVYVDEDAVLFDPPFGSPHGGGFMPVTRYRCQSCKHEWTEFF